MIHVKLMLDIYTQIAGCSMAATGTAIMQVNTSDSKSRIVHNGSAFQKYPPSRPFIHDDYRRDVTKPIISYPESNRQGMIQLSYDILFLVNCCACQTML